MHLDSKYFCWRRHRPSFYLFLWLAWTHQVHICRTSQETLWPASPWWGQWAALGWVPVGERCTPPSGPAGTPGSHSLMQRTDKSDRHFSPQTSSQCQSDVCDNFKCETPCPFFSPSRKGMESVLMVSRATISLLSLELLRLCFCFLLKKDLRAAAERVLLESSFISVTLCLR